MSLYKNNINILQANIQSLLDKKDELIQELNADNYIAALLSETWTSESKFT